MFMLNFLKKFFIKENPMDLSVKIKEEENYFSLCGLLDKYNITSEEEAEKIYNTLPEKYQNKVKELLQSMDDKNQSAYRLNFDSFGLIFFLEPEEIFTIHLRHYLLDIEDIEINDSKYKNIYFWVISNVNYLYQHDLNLYNSININKEKQNSINYIQNKLKILKSKEEVKEEHINECQ